MDPDKIKNKKGYMLVPKNSTKTVDPNSRRVSTTKPAFFPIEILMTPLTVAPFDA